VVVKTCPALSPAAQNDDEVQDADRRRSPGAAGETAIHAREPLVGARESSTRPRLSTAAQNALLGHETEMIRFVPSTRVVVHEWRPPVGSVEVITCPAWSAARQNEVDAHETASTTTPGLTLTFDHE
jgi:hypothetical protein